MIMHCLYFTLVFQSLNFDLTRAYLDLIVTYISLMVLIARVEDRKAVLGLFNYAYEAQNGRRYMYIYINKARKQIGFVSI